MQRLGRLVAGAVYTRDRWYVLMNRKFIVAILLAAAVPMYAHAQNQRVSEGDAQKVVTIISGDKIKTQAYCDIHKLAQQLVEAHKKNDGEKVNELFEKIRTLEKTVGPEYVALVEGIEDISENDQLRAEFSSALEHSPDYASGRDLEGRNAPAATRAVDGTF